MRVLSEFNEGRLVKKIKPGHNLGKWPCRGRTPGTSSIDSSRESTGKVGESDSERRVLETKPLRKEKRKNLVSNNNAAYWQTSEGEQ